MSSFDHWTDYELDSKWEADDTATRKERALVKLTNGEFQKDKKIDASDLEELRYGILALLDLVKDLRNAK